MSPKNPPFECGQSPASPVIKRLRRMLTINTEDLMEDFGEFSEFVKELNDYCWRLTKEEKRFLDSVLRLEKELKDSASFVIAVENVKECHAEVTEAVDSQIEITKETMGVQEEILGICFNEERRVDDRLAMLNKEMKPLVKRKRALQGEIRDDIAKLISRRHSLVDLLDKQSELREDLKPIDENMVKAKRSLITKMGQILTPWKRKSDIFRDGQSSVAPTSLAPEERMRTISNEERLAFLAKARQQKTNPAAGVADPLRQLQVEEAGVKEGRSKRKHDGRIPVEIPGKAAAKEGVVPPLKKQKTEKTIQPAGDADKGKGVASSSSQPPSQDADADAPLTWSSFDPFDFIERGVTMVGDMTRFTNTPTADLRKKALEYEVKGTLLNYLLTNRQEQEVQEAKQKVKTVDDNLADIEKRYTETKTKLEADIKKLRDSQESEAERLKKEYEDKLAKVKESYAASETKLKENAAAQDEVISKLSKEKDAAVFSVGSLGEEKERLETDVKELQLYAANQYEEGFAYALEQVKLLFPDLDAKRLAEADAMNQIIDGKLVPYVPPSE
ncbi:ankycorbin-like [Trifolium pratense]|uniref:ankycorbin-like n=2 Tax=Trifolium pratense TaxID=57577 RepID=UPI001E696C01|nr:ankycorbin-like [Trifolium pratense]